MMETGQLMSAEVMPKLTKRMSEFVRENGALGKSMQTVNAEQGRFQTALTGGKEALFKGGMGEGMAYFFRKTADLIGELEPLAKWLGSFIKGVITGFTAIAKILALPLNMLADIASMFDAGGKFTEIVGAGGVLAYLTLWFVKLTKGTNTFNAALLITLKRIAAIVAPLLALEDLMSTFQGKTTLTSTMLASQGFDVNKMETIWGTKITDQSVPALFKFNPVAEGMYHGYKKAETAVKIFFDTDEAKKLIRVEQMKGNNDAYAGLAAELN